jgi:outer membrane protein assembly factor BamE (lipoprotein component of BamABCDE complex)
MKRVFLGLVFAVLSASASAGTITDVSKVNSIHREQTSAAQVKAILGEPVHEDHNPDGRFIYMYNFDLPNVKSPQAPHVKGLMAFLFNANGTFQVLRVYQDKKP